MKTDLISTLLGLPDVSAKTLLERKSKDAKPEEDTKPDATDEPASEPAQPDMPTANNDSAPGNDAGTEDAAIGAHISDLASLWTTGNKQDVVNEFLLMSNQEAVDLVFVIGNEGAKELALMADTAADLQDTDDDNFEGETERIEFGSDGGSPEVEFEQEAGFEPEMRYDESQDQTLRALLGETFCKEDKDWIQKAVNPKHNGYCKNLNGPRCTPRRKALAMRFKKGDIHADNLKK